MVHAAPTAESAIGYDVSYLDCDTPLPTTFGFAMVNVNYGRPFTANPCFRGEVAFEAGVGEEEALDTVLPWLSDERCTELAHECLELYCWDRLGVDN